MVIFFPENGAGTGGPRLMSPHFGLGLAITVLALMQLLLGVLSPRTGTAPHRGWRMVHAPMGWITLAAGAERTAENWQ
jgi:cytochrome b561